MEKKTALLHMLAADIPADEKKDHIILRRARQIYGLSAASIPYIHPYCLDLSPLMAASLRRDQIFAFTPGQIVYIPEAALVEFPDEFFEHWLAAGPGEQDVWEVHMRQKGDGGVQTVSRSVSFRDRMLQVYARKQFRRRDIERKRKTRAAADEQWKKAGTIHVLEIANLLSISRQKAQRYFQDCRIPGEKTLFNYEEVLKKTGRIANIGEIEDPDMAAEMQALFRDAGGAPELAVMPRLYRGQDAYEALGLAVHTPNQGVRRKIYDRIRSRGIWFDLDAWDPGAGMRFTAAGIRMLYRDPEFERIRRELYERYGIRMEADAASRLKY